MDGRYLLAESRFRHLALTLVLAATGHDVRLFFVGTTRTPVVVVPGGV